MKRPHENASSDRKKRKCLDNTECESASSILEEGELGLIESVSVQNFMCHENLTLNFEPHINFIIGLNGSGKSAVLTAIILALGGKSSSTNRHPNIKSFVKTGKNKAKVEVVLRNSGTLSYKPEVYGEKIVVVREFNKDGVSSYKLKSESGTICSNQKSELINILEAMDIMVECPVCVLTQATSKEFLISKNANPENLFKFFYKGTGLEMLENKYKSMNSVIENAEAELDKKKQTLPDLKKDLRKWKRFLDSSKKISDYKNELIWANAITMEKEVELKKVEHQQIVGEFEEHKRILDGCKKSFAEKSSELDELTKQKNELHTEMDEYRKKLEKLKADYETHASSYRRNKGTMQKLQNDKTKLEEEIIGLERCMNEQNREEQKNSEEEDKKRLNAIQNLQDENFNLEERLKTLRETIHTKRSEQSNNEKVIDRLSTEVNCYHYELKNIEDNLTAMKNAIRNKISTFGEKTENVLREIKMKIGEFRKPPVGPIGMYLEIKDPKWAAAVEYAVGSYLLNSFCVDNHQDSLILRSILRKYYGRPPAIIVSRYESQMFDVKHGRVNSQFPTVLDMLIIKNHLVANCLIDQASIEKKILIEGEDVHKSLTDNQPTNCYAAYYLNCDQICFNPSRFYSFGRRKPNTRLSTIRAEDIKNLEKDKEEKIANISMKRRQIETMEKAKESLPEQIDALGRELVMVSAKYKKNSMEIKELQCKEKTMDVDCLQEELQTLYNSCEQKKEEIKQHLQILLESESKKLDLETQQGSLSAQLKSLNNDYHGLHMKISDVSKLKENFASGKRKYELELKCKENKYKMNQKFLEDIQSKLQTIISRAESTCPRIMTDRSAEEISQLIRETERVVEEQSNCGGENLTQRYAEKLENLHRAEKELKRIERYLVRIREMLKSRNANFHKIRKNTELLIGLTFTTILSGNGYIGHLKFDQFNGTLVMDVSTRASDRTRKNHSSLSGGERSFVTIAFLLSLWERTKMPFRILDEYDVFMDSSNRQLSNDLIIRKAQQMPKTQFLFLSPQELTRMPKLDCIHILRLAPPKRKTDDENSPRKKHS